eukprot:460594-Pelagomonas_calceolata.AAC.5
MACASTPSIFFQDKESDASLSVSVGKLLTNSVRQVAYQQCALHAAITPPENDKVNATEAVYRTEMCLKTGLRSLKLVRCEFPDAQ